MATSKEFTFVGVSEFKGKVKVRYANSKSRVRVLTKNGHTNIFFVEMKHPEQKEDCVDALLNGIDKLPNQAAVDAVHKEARELGFIL